MPKHSRYVLVVDNVSSMTRSRDIEKEFEFAGRIRDVNRDPKARCALVEFENVRAPARSSRLRRLAIFAPYWQPMLSMPGRKWTVSSWTGDVGR